MKVVTPDADSLTSGIQEAIDSDESGYIILSPGEYHIRSQLIIRSGTMLISNDKSILINEMNSKYIPFVVVEQYTDIKYLILNSNNRSGISIGKNGANNSINIGYIKIYNTGNDQDGRIIKAMEIKGFNIIINNIDIFLGNMGLSFENSSDIRINELQIVNCATGIRMFNANNVNISNFSIDSCQYIGLQIDSTHNSYFKGTVWNNNKVYVNNNECGILLGKYSKDLNDILTIDVRIIDTGKTAIYLSNSMNINLNAIICNTEGHNIENAICYGANIKNININGIIDNVPEPYRGKLYGKNNMIANSP